MRVLLTGAAGQLGRELARSVPRGVDLVARTSSELDVSEPEQVVSTLDQVRPQLVVNAAAYTAVDRAEHEEVRARAVNELGVANLATSARSVGSRLVHVSTDFVFDGHGDRPLRPTDPTGPLSAYGRTKLAGEVRAREILGERATVVRTSWLYSGLGRNFVTGMLELMSERDSLRIVDDQQGSPTWAASLAGALWKFAARSELHGIWHWTDAGSCTWYEFARAIQNGALERGLLERTVPIEPVTTADHPTAAERPRYSVLDSAASRAALEIDAVPWSDALGRMLDEMKATGGRP